MPTTPYSPKITAQANNGFSLDFSNTKVSATVAASTDTTYTVSGDGCMGASTQSASQYIAIFKIETGKSVYCAVGATAAVPAGASFASTTSELLISGEGRRVKEGDILHFYTTDAGGANVTILLYSVN